MKPKIYISSMALRHLPAPELVALAAQQGYALEFSSGMPFRPDMEELYSDYPFPHMPHNYFPAPEVPFVLNLASTNPKIRAQSIQHCVNGIKLAAEAGAPFFAAHAGFCIDPNPEELGRKLSQNQAFDADVNWGLFAQAVEELAEVAQKGGTDFLIENNVVAEMNIRTDGRNPLFCGDPQNIEKLFKEVKHPNVGLLLDTAHLKVSSNTLSFDLNAAIQSIAPFIKGIHHSDNDGLLDINSPIPQDYWFAQFMAQFAETPHVLEVKDLTTEQISQQVTLLEQFINQ